jgi:thiosulfate/3-mercaptopyruvate sulfurtransferase
MKHLITASELEKLIAQKSSIFVFDCSFDLVDPNAGLASFENEHIPTAQYAHCDHDLSGPKNGLNGRHPLPSLEQWANTLKNWGVNSDSHVVAYDRQGGMFAARLWWMLRSTGIHHVQVLDGGYQAWLKQNGSTEKGKATSFAKKSDLDSAQPYLNLMQMSDMQKNLLENNFLVVDARPNDRFHGKNETLDPVGGHIPGAVNRFFKDNLTSDGFFKSAAELKNDFLAVIDRAPHEIVHSCGSGATACHNHLAMEIAGLTGSRIYAGSWSEWCATPKNPVETV